MNTTMTQPKLEEVFVAASPIVNPLLVAMATAQLERELANKRHAAILANGAYMNKHNNTQIFNPKDDWRMSDEQSQKYYALCDLANKEAGYNVDPGVCPALVAEYDVIKLENSLIDAVSGLLNIDGSRLYLEKRRKFLDLTIGLVVNHPEYTKPAIAA